MYCGEEKPKHCHDGDHTQHDQGHRPALGERHSHTRNERPQIVDQVPNLCAEDFVHSKMETEDGVLQLAHWSAEQTLFANNSGVT